MGGEVETRDDGTIGGEVETRDDGTMGGEVEMRDDGMDGGMVFFYKGFHFLSLGGDFDILLGW